MPAWWRSASLRRLDTTCTTGQCCLSQRRHYHSIVQAIPREVTVRRVSARDRSQGRIHAVVFSQEVLQKNAGDLSQSSRKYLLTTENKHIRSLLKSVHLPFFCSTSFGLQIRTGSGSSTLLESGKVLPINMTRSELKTFKLIHRDEETGKVLNLVFVWADDGTHFKVDVPVVFQGEDDCPGLKKGVYLNRIRTSLKYICPVEHIPSKIEVDVSILDISDKR